MKVTTAAANPTTSCLAPEKNQPRPVNREVPAPVTNSAEPLAIRLPRRACVPDQKKYGATGKIAPAAKSANDVTVAVHGEPPSSCGSMPSSSRASVSSAVDLLEINFSARASA